MKIKDPEILVGTIENLVPGHAVGFNKKLNKLFEIPVSEIFEKIRSFNDIVYIVIDGILTNRLLTISINMKIKFIACKNKEEKLKIPENLSIFYF
jgi:hypothetical protein